MSNNSTANQIARATDRKAIRVACFDSTDTFLAVYKAEKFMVEHGYNIGSMCGNDPIACSKKASYIAKWRNIDPEEWPSVDAVIVSNDMRNGPTVECYEFVSA